MGHFTTGQAPRCLGIMVESTEAFRMVVPRVQQLPVVEWAMD